MEGKKQKIKKVLKMSNYSLGPLLGTGSFGKVKLVYRKKDNAVFCVKTMKKNDIIESKQTDHIINECEIISQIAHPMFVSHCSHRSGSKASVRTASSCTSSWSTCPVGSCSPTSATSSSFALRKPRIAALI